MLAPALGVLALLFGGALVGAVRQSLEPPLGGGVSTWSVDSWRALAGDPAFWDALAFSARTAVVATLAASALALLIAGSLRRRGTRLRALVALPVPVPHLLVAVTAVLWLSPGGLADRALGALPVDLVRDPLGIGVALVYVYKETPFLVLLLLAVMGTDLDEREEMARVMGHGRALRMRLVVWPAVRAPLATGALIVGAFVFGAFEVPLAIGPTYPPALAEYAYESTRGSALTGSGRAAAALLVAAAASVLLAAAAVRIARAGRR